MMTLDSLIDQYELEHDVKSSTIENYRVCKNVLEKSLGKAALLSDLTPENINRLIVWLKQNGRQKHTLQSRRRGLLVLARYAKRKRLIKFDFDLVVLVRCPETPKDVWTPEQMRELLDGVSKIPDCRLPETHIKRRLYWRSIILAAWDTALRQSDLRSLKLEDFHSNHFTIIQTKTGVGHRGMIRPETLEAIEATFEGPAENRERIWPAHRRKWFCMDFRKIVEQTSLKGTFKKIRRSSITDVELNAPGSGFIHAGHTNPNTTFKWYIPRGSLVKDRLLTSVLENGIGKETKPSFRKSNAS